MCSYRSVSDRMLILGAQDETNPKHGEKIGMALWQKELGWNFKSTFYLRR